MPANNIAKKVKFLGVDGFMITPLLLIMAFPSWFMVYVIGFTLVILFILERKNMTLFMLLRWIRTKVAGRYRFIRPPWRKPMM